jgi:hypothetical protein
MKKAYTFVLNFGYVESSRLSFLPWTSKEKYATARDALVDLAMFLKEKFLERHAVKPKKCCLDSKAKDSGAEFCRKCGRSLVDEDFDAERYMEFVSGIGDCDIDTFHGEYIDWNASERWQTEGLEGAVNQRFVYQAEKVLAAAINQTPDDRRTFETICKDRTKYKMDSFHFWSP